MNNFNFSLHQIVSVPEYDIPRAKIVGIVSGTEHPDFIEESGEGEAYELLVEGETKKTIYVWPEFLEKII